MPKRSCVQYLGATTGISGELGVSESEVKRLIPHYRCPNIDIEQLTNIWLTTLEARNESVASPNTY